MNQKKEEFFREQLGGESYDMRKYTSMESVFKEMAPEDVDAEFTEHWDDDGIPGHVTREILVHRRDWDDRLRGNSHLQ